MDFGSNQTQTQKTYLPNNVNIFYLYFLKVEESYIYIFLVKSYIFKHTHCTLYIENQNIQELQINMLHFLVILILMQFYVIQL